MPVGSLCWPPCPPLLRFLMKCGVDCGRAQRRGKAPPPVSRVRPPSPPPPPFSVCRNENMEPLSVCTWLIARGVAADRVSPFLIPCSGRQWPAAGGLQPHLGWREGLHSDASGADSSGALGCAPASGGCWVVHWVCCSPRGAATLFAVTASLMSVPASCWESVAVSIFKPAPLLVLGLGLARE